MKIDCKFISPFGQEIRYQYLTRQDYSDLIKQHARFKNKRKDHIAEIPSGYSILETPNQQFIIIFEQIWACTVLADINTLRAYLRWKPIMHHPTSETSISCPVVSIILSEEETKELLTAPNWTFDPLLKIGSRKSYRNGQLIVAHLEDAGAYFLQHEGDRFAIGL